jgi:hypothetical protein
MQTLVKWSVADYQRMRDLGILDQRRYELIHGEIWNIALERKSSFQFGRGLVAITKSQPQFMHLEY